MTEENHMISKNGELETSKVESKLDNMPEEKINDIVANFEEFKGYLSQKISLGKSLGLDEEKLAQTAEKVAGYLADHVEPKNREEKLLKELWQVGNEEERHKLAHLLVKLAE